MRSASGGPSSPTTVVAVRWGSSERSRPAPRGQVVDGGRAQHAGERRAGDAPAAQRGDPGRDARAGGEAERPPEGAVHPFGLDPGAGSAELAQPPRDPFRRHPLPLRRRGAVDRGQRLDQIAQPIRSRCGAASEGRPVWHRVAIGGETYRLIPKMGPCRRAAAVTLLSRPGDPDRGRLLVVLRPLPDHPLAVELLPLRARRLEQRRRPLPAGAGERARLLRLDPAARAGPRLRRHSPRDRHLRHHAVDVRRRRADDPGLRLAGHRVQGGDRRPARHPGDRARLRRRSGSPPPARTSSGRRCGSRRGPTRPGSWR